MTLVLRVLIAVVALGHAARFPVLINNETINRACVVEPDLIVLVAESGRVPTLNTSARAWLPTVWQLSQARGSAAIQLVHGRYVVVAGGAISAQNLSTRIDVFDTLNF